MSSDMVWVYRGRRSADRVKGVGQRQQWQRVLKYELRSREQLNYA